MAYMTIPFLLLVTEVNATNSHASAKKANTDSKHVESQKFDAQMIKTNVNQSLIFTFSIVDYEKEKSCWSQKRLTPSPYWKLGQ